MPFSAQELDNITNSCIDFHLKGVESQIIQDRPLYRDLMAGKKTFPGGKDYVDGGVKGVYSTAFTGYSHDDDQNYVNPANVKRWKAAWYEIGAGIMVTHTELKKNGISVTETTTGGSTAVHSGAEKIQLVNLLEDKLEDMSEGSQRSFAEMLWRDGSQDAKAVPGVLSFILGSPSTGVSFGLDRAANSWWRNRASLAIDSSTAANQNLVTKLQQEFRQLRRYAKPNHKFYCGSDFLDAFEKELRSKGNYTLEGWAKSKTIDASVADLAFKGVMLEYDPLLDDLGYSKYGAVLDLNAIKLRPMEGEDMKRHAPARPPEKYVLYKAITWTGALTAERLNSSGLYSIA